MRTAFHFLIVLLGCAGLLRAEQPDLWLYYSTNLQVNQNVDRLQAIWNRAAAAGYTHILLADSKFAKLGDLGDMTRTYFNNIERTRKIAADLKLQIVPALFHVGYSNAMLWHDPNLAEGLPVKDAPFLVKNSEARPVNDPPVSLGGKPTWKDDNVALADGVATVRDSRGNARLSWKLTVAPHRCYHVSVKIRTGDFTGEPRIAAIASDRSLQYESLGIQRTQDWTEHHVVFNTMEFSTVNVYLGVWGDARGELQWKDWKIEEAGLVNVLRRPGAPCVVKGYTEGKDYEPIIDPKMGRIQWKGDYNSWHEPPAIKTRGIPDGTILRVSWYHPAIIYNGQVSCCPSEPATLELLADEARRMQQAWNARGYMMSHDEIRSLNTDESCLRRNLDAGVILADNARYCTGLLKGRDVYVWSDMFDPFHNARRDYYLVRGDLAGSWEGLHRDVIVVNWNFEKRRESLKFFSDRGHRQVIAGYYDHDPHQIRQWLAAAGDIKGIVGVMYTTWQSNFNDLEVFARLCRE